MIRFAPQSIKQFLASAAIMALMLRALIPLGYMPDFEAKGFFPVTICEGADELMMIGVVNAHHHHNQGGHGAHHDGVCPFSIGASFTFDIAFALIIALSLYFAALEHTRLRSRKLAFVFCNASPRSPPFFS